MYVIKDMLDKILKYTEKPMVFEPGEPKFWDDPHISKSMLEAHLNQNNDAASRKVETIDKTVENLINSGVLRPGMKLLDLGCGPGLYAERLAKAGINVVGIDISTRSIGYAKAEAEKKKLTIEYCCMNFFDMDFNNEFDAVIQIYGELNTFSDARLSKLFDSVKKALKPDGVFIFDVTTRTYRLKNNRSNNWYVSEGGFWRPEKHLVLEMGFDYPELDIWLDQYITIDEENYKVYRNWFHDYSLESIKKVLDREGFVPVKVWNDLTGSEYSSNGEWIAIAANKSMV